MNQRASDRAIRHKHANAARGDVNVAAIFEMTFLCRNQADCPSLSLPAQCRSGQVFSHFFAKSPGNRYRFARFR